MWVPAEGGIEYSQTRPLSITAGMDEGRTMHRLIQDHIEQILAGSAPAMVEDHLKACEDCRATVASMREQGGMLRDTLKAPREFEPRPGFYARVMERIEAEGPVSIWNLFFESPFGRRIAVASLALAVLLGTYLVSSEENRPFNSASQHEQFLPGEDQPGLVLAQDGQPSQDAVLVNLVTYGGQ